MHFSPLLQVANADFGVPSRLPQKFFTASGQVFEPPTVSLFGGSLLLNFAAGFFFIQVVF